MSIRQGENDLQVFISNGEFIVCDAFGNVVGGVTDVDVKMDCSGTVVTLRIVVTSIKFFGAATESTDFVADDQEANDISAEEENDPWFDMRD